jgi:hypothetical protein
MRNATPAPSADQVLAMIVKPKSHKPAHHINFRVSGEEAVIFEQLQTLTLGTSDSERVRDAIRLAVMVLTLKKKGQPVKGVINGQEVDLVDFLGIFEDQLSA